MNKKTYKICYYSILREKAGKESEVLETEASDLRGIYRQLNEQYKFGLEEPLITVAINDEFGNWESSIKSGDQLVFMTPVSGG